MHALLLPSACATYVTKKKGLISKKIAEGEVHIKVSEETEFGVPRAANAIASCTGSAAS